MLFIKAGKIRGFMHLDNGQESVPAFIKLSLRLTDKKYSYYRVSSSQIHFSTILPKLILLHFTVLDRSIVMP